MPRDEAQGLVRELGLAWIEGDLGMSLFPDATSITEADRRMGRTWARLPSSLSEVIALERGLGGETDLRRWCWVPGWVLLSQDEDLMVMSDHNVAPLLEEAREGCTKRDYVISIVEHHARDSMHHALWEGASHLTVMIERCRGWIEHARSAQAEGLVAYLERLSTYARRGPVQKSEEVAQRVFDLRRCSPERQSVPVVRRDGARWRAPFARANLAPGELVVELATGRMWAEETAKKKR